MLIKNSLSNLVFFWACNLGSEERMSWQVVILHSLRISFGHSILSAPNVVKYLQECLM